MKILRLKIYQPQAHYRIPFTYQRRHTYPIPPYSTVIGFLINLLGIIDQNSDEYQNGIANLKISIAGKFKSKSTEMIWFRNLSKDAHKSRFNYVENRFWGGHIEHIGGQSQMWIDILNDVELIIYLFHHNEEFLNKINEAIRNPSNRLEVLHLGRAEDWIVFADLPVLLDESKIVYKRQDKDYKHFFWIAEKIFPFAYAQIDYNDFDGIIYNLPVYSEIENYQNTMNKNGKRKFIFMRTKLNDGIITKAKILLDTELGMPIFLGDFQNEQLSNLG